MQCLGSDLTTPPPPHLKSLTMPYIPPPPPGPPSRAIELYDADISFLTNRAAVHYEMGDLDAAIADCDAAGACVTGMRPSLILPQGSACVLSRRELRSQRPSSTSSLMKYYRKVHEERRCSPSVSATKQPCRHPPTPYCAVERGRELRADYKLIGRALTRKGNALVKKGDLEEAIAVYNRSLMEHR
jgi:hypothetical protein